MEITNMNEYQELSKRTMPKIYNGMAKANYALGLVGESGEVADQIKKEVFHEHPVDIDSIKKELGDSLHYLVGLATIYGLTFQEIAEANIEKLRTRYPDGFSTEASIARVDTK